MKDISKYAELRGNFLSDCRKMYGEPCDGDTSVGITPCPYFRGADIDGEGKAVAACCLLEKEIQDEETPDCPRFGRTDLINKDFLSLTPDEFDVTISGLAGLSVIIAPVLLKTSLDGCGIEDAAAFTLDLQIAADAVTEIKRQIYGEDKPEPDGGEERA